MEGDVFSVWVKYYANSTQGIIFRTKEFAQGNPIPPYSTYSLHKEDVYIPNDRLEDFKNGVGIKQGDLDE